MTTPAMRIYWKVLAGDRLLASCKSKKAALAYSQQWYLNNRDPISGVGQLPTVQKALGIWL